MCDIWKANKNVQEITPAQLSPHLESIRKLNVKSVLLSGGEPLMHSNLWAFLDLLKPLGVKVMLLSTGLLLEQHAQRICETCNEVIVSLDGSREVHNRIRGLPHAYETLEAGVAALKRESPSFRVTGRCVVQRANYAELPKIVEAARGLGLSQISFLSADVSSSAFNRPVQWSDERAAEIALDERQVGELKSAIDALIETNRADFDSRFIAEAPAKLRRLPAYYAANLGLGRFPAVRCNAPWVSAVVEADGTVRPCFFHNALGNIHKHSLATILNGPQARAFRKRLKVDRDPICERCVCSLYLK
jgi:MoaA/NifB/PqqE/SkfB family radical SAM enzyme